MHGGRNKQSLGKFEITIKYMSGSWPHWYVKVSDPRQITNIKDGFSISKKRAERKAKYYAKNLANDYQRLLKKQEKDLIKAKKAEELQETYTYEVFK